MTSISELDNGAISFAERVLTLINQGSFSSTYKYAVLLSLMDLVLEQSGKNGLPPTVVTTRQLAEKIIELYWPHTNPFDFNSGNQEVLLQTAGARGAQARIISLISEFKIKVNANLYAPYYSTILTNKAAYRLLVNKVEWKIIEMPLPKLQRIGSSSREFIYNINWDDGISQRPVTLYQRGEESDFDNRIILLPNVGEYLVRLNSLLRPLIQREWSTKVAHLNNLQESKLQKFLFDSRRRSAAVLCDPLTELQDNRCFYCGELIGRPIKLRPEVDHFIPWSRYSDDSVSNYVIAHNKCNAHKSDFLAGNNHVVRWINRLNKSRSMDDLTQIAKLHNWKLGAESTKGVAAAIYMHLQPEVELWKIGEEFEAVNIDTVESLFLVTSP